MAQQPPASNGPSKRRRIAGETKPGEAAPAPTPPKTVRKPVARPGVPRTSEKSAAPAGPPPAPIKTPKAKAKASRAKATPANTEEAPATAKPVSGASTAPVTGPITGPSAETSGDTARQPSDASDQPTRASLKAVAPLALAAVLAVVLGVLGAGWGVQAWRSDHGVTSAHDAAADAAADAAETIFTYDYTSLDAHLKSAQKLMTPAFAKKFATISPALDQLAPQRKIQVKAESRDSAAVPCGDDCSRTKASVLLFVDQARLADGSTTPTVFGNRITMSMVKSDGRWLVSDITAL